MLKSFLIESGIPKLRASKVALQAMYLSTQEFLGWIKYTALQSLEKEYPDLRFHFAFFKNNIWVEKKTCI